LTPLKVWRHGALYARKAAGRLHRRLIKIPDRAVVRTINGTVRFEHRWLPFLDEGDFRAMLTQSYDIILCDYLKRHLKPGDIVLDAGANVGYISAVAASYVKASGEVHGFEPLAECFARLERLRELNPGLQLFFNNVALGDVDGVLPIAYNPHGDSRNATLVPGKQSEVTREVPVQRLDEYIRAKISSPERIRLIKIDVEGFEYSVLRGLSTFFRETSSRPLIVCEVKPWELSRLGATNDDFERYMKEFGYRAYRITHDDTPVSMNQVTDMEILVFRS
jgi:FkbM family methyltransferase